ncbi:MAG TPA: outer membrane beta-barrel protein [Salinivirga sp.]|uniref:outer membrane beta-barrel protein n=1 Tax=Salinivirga sp. TaxID=1970192 RepID=UPI002B498C22|nr:outer membrane beta-barrel protein [Salinivirga sp.]HKK60393.1 outer membrane beta-barrel protein [Salinivirga sp.]
MKKITLLFALISLLFVFNANGQKISISGHVGYSSPQGDAFTYDEGSGGKGGFGYSVDILYHLPQFDNKLAVGLIYNDALLVGGGTSDSNVDLDMYLLGIRGVKGQYRFFDSKVSPYGAVSLGASRLEVPEVTSNDEVIAEGGSTYAFGIAPEIGVELGGFVISAMYLVPMKYETWGSDEDSAGSFQISIGWRGGFDL